MGIVKPFFDRIEPHITQGAAVLSLGYPDLLVKAETPEIFKTIDTDSDRICQYHGIYPPETLTSLKNIVESREGTLDVLDFAEVRGGEIVKDLNQDWDAEFSNRYDLIIDPGTLEHCFNIGVAFRNLAESLTTGGVIAHWNPFHMPNHGFFELQPTAYWDFYWANGFEILSMDLVNVIHPLNVGSQQVMPLKMPEQATGRFRFLAQDSISCMVFARKVKEQGIKWPIQTKYKGLLNATTSK